MPRPRAPSLYMSRQIRDRATERASTLERDARVWELRREGRSTAEMAKVLNTSPKVIDEAIARIFRDYRVGITGEVEAKAGELIAQYEYVRDESLEAWRQSKQAKKRVSQTTTRRGDDPDPNGGVISTTASQDDFHGDPKYLETALKAMDKLATLLRVQDAVQVTVTHQGPDGGPVRVMSDINYDELEGPKLSQYLAALGQAAIVVSQPLIELTATNATSEPIKDVTPVEVEAASTALALAPAPPPDEPDIPF